MPTYSLNKCPDTSLYIVIKTNLNNCYCEYKVFNNIETYRRQNKVHQPNLEFK